VPGQGDWPLWGSRGPLWKRVMVFGVAVCFFISLLYPFMTNVGGFLVLRFLHGISTGFTPTGTSAYVADIIPFSKRG
jgi:MFS family permease